MTLGQQGIVSRSDRAHLLTTQTNIFASGSFLYRLVRRADNAAMDFFSSCRKETFPCLLLQLEHDCMVHGDEDERD